MEKKWSGRGDTKRSLCLKSCNETRNNLIKKTQVDFFCDVSAENQSKCQNTGWTTNLNDFYKLTWWQKETFKLGTSLVHSDIFHLINVLFECPSVQFLPLRCFLLPLSKIVGEGRECIGIGFFFFFIDRCVFSCGRGLFPLGFLGMIG